jgi:hypothetical protein
MTATARDIKSNADHELLGPPIALSSDGSIRRAVSPALLRAGALLSRGTLRLDLHPSDLDRPRHMLALEWVLQRCAGAREAVTYEQLASRPVSERVESLAVERVGLSSGSQLP